MKPENSISPLSRSLLWAFGPAVIAVSAMSPAWAGTLAEKPLFLGVPVPPNVIVGIDDSSSMQAEQLMSYGGDQYRVPTGSRALLYLFPDGNHVTSPFPDNFSIPPLPQFADARSPVTNRAYFDPAARYTPWTSYGGASFADAPPTAAPWDPVYGNSAAAPFSGLCDGGSASLAPGFPNKFDLTRNIACADRFVSSGSTGPYSVGYGFDARNVPVAIPAGTRYWSGSNWEEAGSGGLTVSAPFASLGLSYFPATFYLPHGFPNPYSHYTAAVPTATTTRVYTAEEIGDLQLPVGLAWDGKTWDHYEIKPGNFSDAGEYHAAIQNFANWFTYYRTRHAATRGAIGSAFKDISNMWLAVFKASDADPPHPLDLTLTDLNSASAAADLFNGVYGMHFEKKTSTLNAAEHMGKQLQRDGIIRESCQKNYGILFTDGTPDVPFAGSVGNVDGSYGSPYADSLGNTMADIAMKYYVTNLNGSLPAGQVPTLAACDNPDPEPWLDCQENLHMNFYGVSLGLKGTQYDPLSSTTRSAYASPTPSWPTALGVGSNALEWEDDLWHATINGRGELLSATRPAEVRDKLIDILNAIVSRKGSGAAVAVSSAFMASDLLVYQTVFDPGTWTGDLIAYHFRDDAMEPVWEASRNLPAYPGRHIFSSVPQGTYCSKSFGTPGSVSVGIVFDWNALSCNQQALLDTTLEGLTDTLGEDRLNYIKGDTSKEQRNGGGFRDRVDSLGNENLLGDFVNSAPTYTAASIDEDFGYSLLPDAAEASGYRAFLLSKAARTPMIYVGGNDGMLHAFNASMNSPPGGTEVFAYVPAGVYDRLSGPSSPAYNEDTHRFSVDGSPWVGDAYLDGAWGTYLVGTAGAGARSLFAIDITHPDPAAADAGQRFDTSKIKWDLSGTGTSLPNLGYTLARPSIVRTNSTSDKWKWVVLLGNGYNSPNGHAVLLVVSLADGSVKEFDTQAGGNALSGGLVASNGLATPIAVDLDQNRTVDLVYAGDLLGNVWKFDLSRNDGDWKFAYGTSAAPAPLFTACAAHTAGCAEADRQPITVKPQVSPVRTSRGGFTVLVGTGKYFENGDNIVGPTPQLETFYGLWDKNTGTNADRIGGATLVEQTIDSESEVVGGHTVRVTSANPVDFQAGKNGWYLDLKPAGGTPQGERVVSDPVYFDGRIAFSSFAPTQGTCTVGGTGWLMELDAETGSRPRNSAPIFDLGGGPSGSGGEPGGTDGRFDSADLATTAGGTAVAPSGLSSSGIPTSTRIVREGSGILRITGNSKAGTSESKGPCGSPCELGRQSWQQLQ